MSVTTDVQIDEGKFLSIIKFKFVHELAISCKSLLRSLFGPRIMFDEY